MFTLTDTQRLLLATARAWQGEGERRFDHWSRRETMQAATQAFAQTLAASGLRAGRPLAPETRARLLHLAASLAPNRTLSRRLHAAGPAAFDRRLGILLLGDDSLEARLRQFVAAPGAGAFTAAQLLCASAPDTYPLLTRAALRRLRLTAAQKRAALADAAARYEFALPPAPDAAQSLLALFVAYEDVRRALGALSFPEVDDLLKGDWALLPSLWEQESPGPRPRQIGTALTPQPPPPLAGEGEHPIPRPLPLREGQGSKKGGLSILSDSSPSRRGRPGEGAPPPSEVRAAVVARETNAHYDTAPPLTETGLLAALEEYALGQGFTFPPHLLRSYYIALQTKPFAILSGVSGSGKTKMAELFAEMLTGHAPAQFRLLPVRPDWADSAALFGYHNVLANRSVSTPFLDMARAAARPEHRARAYFVCLDEMNLARVEHYLADYLSALESRSHRVPLHEDVPDFVLPPNVFVTGTVNVDETTHAFSRKVLDRANTLDFDAAPVSLGMTPGGKGASLALGDDTLLPVQCQQLFLQSRVVGVGRARERLSQIDARFGERALSALQEVNDRLHAQRLHFAYRVRDDVLVFVANAFDAQTQGSLLLPDKDENFTLALDLQMCQKVLPRISGLHDTLAPLLADLQTWAEAWPLPRMAARLARMRAHAAQTGYVRFYE